MLHIGCHLSASAGYLAMGNAALSIGADTFQFFTRNPRGNKAKDIDPSDAEALALLMREHDFYPTVAHAPYTLNPCSADEHVREFAALTMTDDLRRLAMLPCGLYNLHPGSHTGQGPAAGIAQTAALLKDSVENGAGNTVLLIETMSGQGSEIGCTFEQIAEMIERAGGSHRIGVCLDTCHVFAAGYDVRNDLDGVLTAFDRVIGLDRLNAVHLNDSLKDLGEHRDRHAPIGLGRIGKEAMLRIVRHPALRELPFILETPHDTLTEYAAEIRLLQEEAL